MKFLKFILPFLIIFGPTVSKSNLLLDRQKIITTLAFGSCAKENKKQKIWQNIQKENPDLFIFLGDNIYADTEDMDVMKSKYSKFWNNPYFKSFRNNVPLLATWDDHDYGQNDAGEEYPKKKSSKNIFLHFFDPSNTQRRNQKGGIYTSYLLGPVGKKLHIIILDTRWSRTKLLKEKRIYPIIKRTLRGMGPYRPNPNPNAKILGDEQWAWLEKELKIKADLRVLVTSIQVLADFTGWESWANFPKEREKLLNLLKKNKKPKTIILSGDVHRGEIARLKLTEDLTLVEVTSSGLTQTTLKIPPNKNRLFPPFLKDNYGLLKIDWGKYMTLSIKGKKGKSYKQYKIPFLNNDEKN
jgi:alkaline phosphatase D